MKNVMLCCIVGLIVSCNPSLQRETKEMVGVINNLEKKNGARSYHIVKADSIKFISGFFPAVFFEKHYDTTIVMNNNECDLVSIEYVSGKSFVQLIECGELKWESVSLEKNIFRKNSKIDFTVRNYGKGSQIYFLVIKEKD